MSREGSGISSRLDETSMIKIWISRGRLFCNVDLPVMARRVKTL
jgi:hypothetical protein